MQHHKLKTLNLFNKQKCQTEIFIWGASAVFYNFDAF